VIRTVKSLYPTVNPLPYRATQRCGNVTLAPNPHRLRRRDASLVITVPAANPTVTRRQNVLVLFQAYAEQAMATGAPPKGLEQAFAATVQISPSMWSQIKSSRPIGDKLARQIETHAGKPVGWLDEPQTSSAPSSAEAAFLELALSAYRATNVAGRKALRQHLKTVVDSAATSRSGSS